MAEQILERRTLVANNDGTVTDNSTGLQLYGAPELSAPRVFPVRPS